MDPERRLRLAANHASTVRKIEADLTQQFKTSEPMISVELDASQRVATVRVDVGAVAVTSTWRIFGARARYAGPIGVQFDPHTQGKIGDAITEQLARARFPQARTGA